MNKLYSPFQPTLTNAGLHQLGLRMQSREPCESLKGIVHSYLQINVDRQTLYPVMPDGTQAIYISPQGSLIGGTLTEARDIQLLYPGEYFGIWFYPGALRHLFAINLSEISDQFVDSKYFRCNRFNSLHTEIYKHKDFNDRVAVCERWVMGRYIREPTSCFDHALFVIYQSFGGERIDKIAGKVGWSRRHLNRRFLEYTGVGTKAFAKIVRAQTLYRQLYQISVDSTQNLMDLGYYDQSHLIKEFKKYFKLTPGEFINHNMSDFYNR
ncbi:MAG: helix-turn-helix domain-containing protein [Gammaproteobacteria bacterium]|nr:helix-turn-helix domain-containing protein [Gammaproteobacteria bacterium]MDH5802489.1 helix-turn-helix domain-containing protein [Gammaproteobacteria bacterium]